SRLPASGGGRTPIRRTGRTSSEGRHSPQVAVGKPLVAQNHWPDFVRNPRAKARTGRDEGVELAALPARIHRCGELVEQRVVVGAARKRGVELRRVDADQSGVEAAVDEFAGQRARVAAPEWKEAAEPEPRQLLLAIAPHVFQK